ncbi:MAG: hypothetical protein V2A67_11830 [Bacteroidota bacterium]
MKNNTVVIVAGIATGLVLGFLAGILLRGPRPDDQALTGTITKVDKYRNIKTSEAEIRLQKDLVSDSAGLQMLTRYITFHYLDAVKLSGDIVEAVEAANALEPFNASARSQIDALERFGLFLSSTRLYYVAALAAIRDPENTDAGMIRHSLNQVNNIISQKNYRTRVVLSFLEKTEAFTGSGSPDVHLRLRQAHDRLALDLVNTSVITGDKFLQKALDNKVLLADYRKLAWYDQRKIMKQVRQDVEKLGNMNDPEKFQFLDAEKLGYIVIGDAEKKSIRYGDAEKMAFAFLDEERVGFVPPDAEKLGGLIFDATKLDIFIDAAKMGIIVDAGKYGSILDAELANYYLDEDRLGIIR